MSLRSRIDALERVKGDGEGEALHAMRTVYHGGEIDPDWSPRAKAVARKTIEMMEGGFFDGAIEVQQSLEMTGDAAQA